MDNWSSLVVWPCDSGEQKVRDARSNQAVDNSIGDQLRLVNADDRALEALLSFGGAAGRVSPKEQSIVNRCIAGQLPRPGQAVVVLT